MPSSQALERIPWEDVTSSNVHSVSLVEPANILCVRFSNGGLYSYTDVDRNNYESLVAAPSVGHYLNAVIKVLSPYRRWQNERELLDWINVNPELEK